MGRSEYGKVLLVQSLPYDQTRLSALEPEPTALFARLTVVGDSHLHCGGLMRRLLKVFPAQYSSGKTRVTQTVVQERARQGGKPRQDVRPIVIPKAFINIIYQYYQHVILIYWRREWDSNPRNACALNGFRVRCVYI